MPEVALLGLFDRPLLECSIVDDSSGWTDFAGDFDLLDLVRFGLLALAFAGDFDLLGRTVFEVVVVVFTGDCDLLDRPLFGLSTLSFVGDKEAARLKAKAVLAFFEAFLAGLRDCGLFEPVFDTFEFARAFGLAIVLLRPRTGLTDALRAGEEERSLE